MTAGTSVFQFWLIIAAAKTEGVKILRSTLDPNDYSGAREHIEYENHIGYYC